MWGIVLFVGVAAVAFYELRRAQNPALASTGPAVCGIDYPTCCCGDCMNCGGQITHDPASWPTGDKVWDVCHAIALAEGANIAGDNPDMLNNPGDLSKGDEHGQAVSGYQTLSDGEVAIQFQTKEGGWAALYTKIDNIRLGISLSYRPGWTWARVAQTYAGDSADWVASVTRELGVSPNDTFGSYFA